ncbi:MAG TPA: transcriptional regulator [Rectinemataceae bacterium]|nr:transcriptional regulator [Rectinemataceae bacterium]
MSSGADAGGSRSGSSGSGRALARLDLDKIIHERARLMILTFLASSDKAETGFTEIRDTLGLSAGNLSVQLRTLEEAGYVKIEKRFVENKPYTGVGLTVSGQKALSEYLGELEVIVASLKGGSAAALGAAPGAIVPAAGREGEE